LFDVLLDPHFESNQLIYLSYAHGDKNNNATRIARAKLTETELLELEVIFEVTPTKDTPVHYGGRMAFLEDGTLMMTTGDGFDYREQAQALDTTLGKTIRINTDGTIPDDNPFRLEQSANEAIWSYGHRNPQGLVHDPLTNLVYLHEHGPRGGDELNLIKRGKNYGWPVMTHGLDYNGAYVSPFKERPNMKQALLYWVPSIAPAGLTIYRGDQFPEWQGSLFVATVVDEDVKRIVLNDGKAHFQEALFSEIGERIRDIRSGPDGFLYLLTDSDSGRVIRVKPAKSEPDIRY
jgi:glucose/arabinose dehydrogenase